MEPWAYDEMSQREEGHWWYLGLRRLTGRALDRFCPDLSEGLVLDAGCGTGGWLKRLLGRRPGLKAIGLDAAPAALRLARAKPAGYHLVSGSVNSLPFLENQFEVVFSLDVIYHQRVNPSLALEEMARVLIPGGFLFVNVPAFKALRGAHDVAVHGRRRFTRPQLDLILGAHGFRPVFMTYWNTFLLPAMVAQRLLSRQGLGTGQPSSSDLAKAPGLINAALVRLIRLEVDLSLLWSWSVGGSVFAVARKTG